MVSSSRRPATAAESSEVSRCGSSGVSEEAFNCDSYPDADTLPTVCGTTWTPCPPVRSRQLTSDAPQRTRQPSDDNHRQVTAAGGPPPRRVDALAWVSPSPVLV